MGVKDQMIGILRSNETSRIAFTFKGSTGSNVSIAPVGFRNVAAALAEGKIAVVENRFNTDTAMYSASSDPATSAAANTFYLGKNPRYSRLFNALIVHESTHAYFDLSKATIPWIDNETAAYIAQAYYARNSGLPRLAFEYGSPPIVAYSVVEAIRANKQSDIDFFLNALRDLLNSSSLYSGYISGTFTGDG